MKSTPFTAVLLVLVILPFARSAGEDIETIVQRDFNAISSDAAPADFYAATFFQVSADERLVLLGRPSELHVYDLRTRCLLDRIENPIGTVIGGAALDPSGRFLVLARGTAPAYDPMISIRSLRSGIETERQWLEVDDSGNTAQPLFLNTSELDPENPLRILVGAKEITFEDLATGEAFRRSFSTPYDAIEPEESVRTGLTTADGKVMRWSGGSELTFTDEAGNSVTVPLIADPTLRCVTGAELHFPTDGDPLICGIDGRDFFLTNLFTDENLMQVTLPEIQNPSEDEFALSFPAFDFSPDAGRVALYNGGSLIEVYDTADGARLAQFTGSVPFDLSENGSVLACFRSGSIHCFDIDRGAETVIPRPDDPSDTPEIALSPDGNLLAAAAFLAGEDPGAIYDVWTARQLFQVPNMNQPLQFDDAGRRVAFSQFGGHWDADLGVVDVESGEVLLTSESVAIHDYHPSAIAFGPGGDSLLVPNGGSGVVRLPIGDRAIGPAEIVLGGRFRGAVRHRRDRSLAAAERYDGTILLFRPDQRDERETARVHLLNTGRAVSMTPDFKYMASPASLDAIAFRIGAEAFPVDQFDTALNQPDVVLSALGAPEEMIEAARLARERRLRRAGLSDSAVSFGSAIPKLRIENRAGIPLASDADALPLVLAASKGDAILHRLLLHVNDVPVSGRGGIELSETDSEGFRTNVSLPLATGSNKIQASVLDAEGNESIRETLYVNRVGEGDSRSRTWLLSIGVADYADDRLDLGLAAKDARDIAEAFVAARGGDSSRIVYRILEDGAATREDILAAKSFFSSCSVDDTAVIFVAGHGFRDENYNYWFGTPDIDYENPGERGLGYDDLESLFEGIPAQRRILLMDTCFAGEVDPEEIRAMEETEVASRGVSVRAPSIATMRRSAESSRLRVAPLVDRYFGEFRERTGASVLTASSGVEFVFAEETEEIGNGVFTHCVMQSLRDPALADTDEDGNVRVSELLDHISREVPALTSNRQKPTGRQLNRELNPVVAGRIDSLRPGAR